MGNSITKVRTSLTEKMSSFYKRKHYLSQKQMQGQRLLSNFLKSTVVVVALKIYILRQENLLKQKNELVNVLIEHETKKKLGQIQN